MEPLWAMEPLYVVSVAVAHAAANLDELPIIFALIPIIGVARAAGGFLIAQLLSLAAALVIGAAAAEFAAQYAHWLGLIPLVLGLRALWRRYRGGADDDDDKPPQEAMSLMLTVLLFIGLSMDSFAIMTAIFADSQAAFDIAALTGALISIAAITACGVLFGRMASKIKAITERLEKLAPFVMIAVGLYVLFDTPTDID